MPWDNPRGWRVGPWWFRLGIGPYGNGWDFDAFGRDIVHHPIDYSKTGIFFGKRRWNNLKIYALDLRKEKNNV